VINNPIEAAYLGK